MTVHLKHQFVNPQPDGADTTITRPSDWNADHNLTGTAFDVLGFDSSGNAKGFDNFQWYDAVGAASAPTVTPHGATGTTTYTYQIVPRTPVGQGLASPVTTITNGNATLGVSNYNIVSWTAVSGAAYYDVFRLTGGPNDPGRVARSFVGTTFNDQNNSTAYPAGGDEFNELPSDRSNGAYVSGNMEVHNGYINIGQPLNVYADSTTQVPGGIFMNVTNANATDFTSNFDAVHLSNNFTDLSLIAPAFSDAGLMFRSFGAINGDNSYGGGTTAKTTFYSDLQSVSYNAAGQKFIESHSMDACGMGDAFLGSHQLQHMGGPIAGDEGCGFLSVSNIYQPPYLVQDTIGTLPTRSSANTTTTQSITASINVQTVTVASTTGINVGDWVVIEQSVDTGANNIEAVKVTAVGAGTISGQFRCNHANGVTVTPALLMTLLGGGFEFGQQRVIVDLSGASYSTGTVTSIVGGEFIGTTTGWTANMVGGNALNVGAIALTADDFTSSPFGAGSSALKSWYQINAFVDATHIGIHSLSVAGDQAYHGQGPGSGGYIVRPAARLLLRIQNTDGNSANDLFVCETSTHTWTVGDTVESAICPYPDVTGYQYGLTDYTAGGIHRGFMQISNKGARNYGFGFNVWTVNYGGNNADTFAWGTGYNIGSQPGSGLWCGQIGFNAGPCVQTGFVANGSGGSPQGVLGFHSVGMQTGLTIESATTNGIWTKDGTIPNRFYGPLYLGATTGAGGTTGIVNFNGSTVGTISVTVPASTTSWTMTLPSSAGTNLYVLQTDGTGICSWVPQSGGSSGITVNSTTISGGTSGRIAYDNAGTFGEAAHTNIVSGQINVDTGFTYLYGGSHNALYAIPNASGDNFFEGEAGPGPASAMTGYQNFGTGSGALAALTSGTQNLAVGSNALSALTTGQQNVALGPNAMAFATNAGGCLAVGSQALYPTTSPSFCVAIGQSAMGNTSGGSNDVAIGQTALYNETSGHDNMAIGYRALNSTTTGANSVAVGSSALQNTTVQQNVAVGQLAGGSLAGGAGTATGNTLIGSNCGLTLSTGNYNTGVGDTCFYLAGTTNYSTAVGHQALISASGWQNTGIGRLAGINCTSGGANSFFGHGSGGSIATGSNNLILGDGSGIGPAADVSNVIMLGVNSANQLDYNLTKASAWTVNAPAYFTEAAKLVHTTVSLTAGSTANVPTLTTGPVNGNPTKWIAIDDNGTTRYIPTW